jgi:hypothetical protein
LLRGARFIFIFFSAQSAVSGYERFRFGYLRCRRFGGRVFLSSIIKNKS